MNRRPRMIRGATHLYARKRPHWMQIEHRCRAVRVPLRHGKGYAPSRTAGQLARINRRAKAAGFILNSYLYRRR